MATGDAVEESVLALDDSSPVAVYAILTAGATAVPGGGSVRDEASASIKVMKSPMIVYVHVWRPTLPSEADVDAPKAYPDGQQVAIYVDEVC